MKIINQISAGGIVYKKIDSQLLWLITQHSQHKGWVFPKGLVGDNIKDEPKETAALREVEEETGISRKDMRIIPGFRMTDKYLFFREKRPIFKIVIFYLVETKKRDIKLSHEHEGYAWFLPKEAVAASKFSNSKAIIKKAYDFVAHPHPHRPNKK